MNGSDEVVFLGWGGDESVFVEEFSTVDCEFKLFGVVIGQCRQKI